MIHSRAAAPPFPVPVIISAVAGALVLVNNPREWLLALVVGLYGVLWMVITGDQFENPLEVDKLYLLFFAMYCVLPFAMAAIFPERSDTSILDPVTLLCVVLGMFGLLAGGTSNLAARIAHIDYKLDAEWNRNEAVGAGALMIVVGLGLFLMLLSRVGLATYLDSNYVASYQAEFGLGYLAVGVYFVQVGMLVLILALSDYRRKISWLPLALFAAYAAFFLRIGRRGLVLAPAIALLMIVHFYYKPLKWKLLIATALVLIALFAVIGQMRAYSERGWEGMVASLDEFTSDDALSVFDEANAVPISIYETTRYVPDRQPFRLGMSYVEAFEILIPLQLHPTRPLASSQWFAWFYNPKIAAEGGGYSYSLMAEGYLNFGFLGVFLVCFVQVTFIRMLVIFRRNNPVSKSRLLLYAAISTQVVYMIRGDFGGFLKLALVTTVLPAIVVAKFLGRSQLTKSANAIPAVVGAPALFRRR